jgi:thiamine biosynthesis lipoprotein
MTADAYATAFMVLGLEESIALAENTPGLDAVFIFSTPDQLDVYVTTGMSEAITFVEEL